MLPDRLVTMANQIGRFFAVQAGARGGDERAVAEIAEHLRRFWDPRMRDAIVALSPDAAAHLDPLPRRAVEVLAADKQKPATEPESPSGG